MGFPERIYTADEIENARKLVEEGHRHSLSVTGSAVFQEKVDKALRLIKVAGYDDFLTSYIRSIVEVDGFTQLREAEAELWINKYAAKNLVDVAGLFIQKAHRMREYLEGKLHFGGAAESRSIQRRIDFLEALKNKSESKEIREECEKLLESWTETVFL